MASPAPNLRVRISADLADIKQGLGLLRGELAKVKTQAAAAMPANNAFANGIRRARAELGGLVATYLSLRGASLLAGLADEAALLRGRVREAKGDYAALLELSQRTRTGLSATVDLYARLERSTRAQQLGQQKLLTLTESINQAVALSYTSAAAGEAALFQLGQGLGAGALRGEELNSVMEQTPRLAQAIADGLGVPIGKLRDLAKEGKLTAEVVTGALSSQAEVLAREYGRIPVTIKSAFTTLRNALVDYVGDQDEATGASRRFAEAIQQMAKDLPKYLDPVLRAFTVLLQNLDTLAVFMVTRMAGAAIPAMLAGFTRLRAMIAAATTATWTLRGALALLGGPVGIAIAALASGLYYLYQRTSQAKVAAEEHTKALKANKDLAYQSRDAALADAKAKRQQALDTLKAAQAALAEAQIRQRESLAQTARGGDRGDAAVMGAGAAVRRAQAQASQAKREYEEWGKRLVEMALQVNDEVIGGTAVAAEAATTETGKALAASNALLRDAVTRALAELDRLNDDNAIGTTEYFRQRQALQERAIDLQIEQARAEMAVTKDLGQRRKLEEEIVVLQRDRAEVAAANARAEKKAIEEIDKAAAAVDIARMENADQLARATRARLEEEYKAQIVRLQADGREDDVRTIRLHIDSEVAKAQLSQFENEMAQTLARLQESEQSLAAQQQAGLLGVLESERQVKQEREGSIEQLTVLRERALAFLATLSEDSPEAAKVLAFLRQLDGNIAVVASSMDRFRQQVADAAIDSVTNLFMDLVEGSKSAGEALRDFVRGFVLSMAQIAARALATYLVLQLLDAIYPGLGKATAATMSAGVAHAGGIAGSLGRVRQNLSPLLFGEAPRLHSGGIAGLGPNEVPAVLEKGEEVLTRNDPRHRWNGGSSGGRDAIVKQPIVAIGDRAVADALAGAAGEDVVITHVRNNWQALSGGR